jgi:exonuclease III
MNGFAAPSHNMSGIEKWSTINRTMSDLRIAILAIQETHLDDELESQVAQCYGKRLTLITSHNPTLPRASAGVAFVINKRLIKPSNITVFKLLAGRALALKIKWHDTEVTTLLNVYAPNTRAAQPEFWRKIDVSKRLYGLRNPDFMLGDFNVTEDAIDRSPPHLDDADIRKTAIQFIIS